MRTYANGPRRRPADPAARCGSARSRRCDELPTAAGARRHATRPAPQSSKRMSAWSVDGISSSASANGSGSQVRRCEQPAAETNHRTASHRASRHAFSVDRLASVDIIRTSSVVYTMSRSTASLRILGHAAASGRRARPHRPHAARAAAPVRAAKCLGVELYAKAEWQNPGGSVKDRAAARMVIDGEAIGPAPPGKDDPRRDVRQHRHRLRDGRRREGLPGEALRARQRQPGAQADFAGARRRAGAHRSARRHRRRDSRSAAARTPTIRIATSIPTNTTTIRTGAHITTRPRPRSSSRPSGRLTHFVAGLGTSGTFMGTGRRLRQFNPTIRLISFQPDSPFHGLEGLKHMATAIVPGIYDPSLADEDLRVSTERAHRHGSPSGEGRRAARGHFFRRRARGHARGRAPARRRRRSSRCFPTARRNI